tara:strand:- start:226 stop:648 length:423 start_codon:yes stop_codon:yes gene_type:complete
MPAPMEQSCWNTIFNLTLGVGSLHGFMLNNDRWNDDLLAAVGMTLADMGECMLAEQCLEDGLAVADALNVLADNPDITDKEKARKEVNDVGEALIRLVGCLHETYATTATIIQEEPLPPENWPDNDYWLQRIYPSRVKRN